MKDAKACRDEVAEWMVGGRIWGFFPWRKCSNNTTEDDALIEFTCSSDMGA